MKNAWLFLLASALTAGYVDQAEAAIIKIESPGTVIDNRQPLLAIITDSNGNVYRQMVYYDPATAEIDIDLNLAPNTSIFIPALNVRYILYNGFWVDQTGYYWNGTQRVFVNDPNWNVYWTRYWDTHKFDRGQNWRKGHRFHGRDSDGWHGRNYEGSRYDRDDVRHSNWSRDGRFDGDRSRNWQDRESDNRQPGSPVQRGNYSGQDGSAFPSRGFEDQPVHTMPSDGQPGMIPSGGFEGQSGSAMRSHGFESGQPGSSNQSRGFEGQPQNTMRSSSQPGSSGMNSGKSSHSK
jgi:hypothetical protein